MLGRWRALRVACRLSDSARRLDAELCLLVRISLPAPPLRGRKGNPDYGDSPNGTGSDDCDL